MGLNQGLNIEGGGSLRRSLGGMDSLDRTWAGGDWGLDLGLDLLLDHQGQGLVLRRRLGGGSSRGLR